MACRKTPGRPGALARLALAVLSGTAAVSLPAQDRPWVVNGPAGGTAYCLAASASDPATLYAGTDDGVFVGTRGGTSWAPANRGIEGTQVQAIAVDPKSPETLYAGTVTALGLPSIGIFKSVDGGAHWTAINSGLEDPFSGASPVDVAAIAIDPEDSSTLLIGTVFSEVYKSTDGGATWNAKTFGGFGAGIVITDIRYDPLGPSLVYAASNLGFLASTDGGETWNFAGDAGVGLTALAVDPTVDGTLYAVNATGFGVFKSTDFGNHWASVDSGLVSGGNLPLAQAIALDPSDPQTVVIGTSGDGAFISHDGAATWSPTGAGTVGVFVHAIAFPAAIVVGTFGDGVFRTEDGGSTWAPANAGFDASLVPALIADPAVPGRLLAGAFNGISVTADGGSTWTFANAGLPSDPVNSLARGSDGRLYAGTIGGGLFTSDDGAASWTASANGLSDPDVSSVAVDPTNPLTVYAGTSHPYDGTDPERVFKSTDGGKSWTQTSLDAGGLPIGILVVDPAKPAQVAAVSPGAGAFFQSTNSGGDWSTVTPSASCGPVNAALYDDADGAVLLGVGAGICRSADGGSSWTVIPVASLTSVTALFADPIDVGTLYAGAQPLLPGGAGGVFRSTDGGLTWSPAGTALSSDSVRALARDASGDRLYAALYGNSVAALSLSAPSRSPIESATPPPKPRVTVR